MFLCISHVPQRHNQNSMRSKGGGQPAVGAYYHIIMSVTSLNRCCVLKLRLRSSRLMRHCKRVCIGLGDLWRIVDDGAGTAIRLNAEVRGGVGAQQQD